MALQDSTLPLPQAAADHLAKAKDTCLAAVTNYNRPGIAFRTRTYTSTAWAAHWVVGSPNPRRANMHMELKRYSPDDMSSARSFLEFRERYCRQPLIHRRRDAASPFSRDVGTTRR